MSTETVRALCAALCILSITGCVGVTLHTPPPTEIAGKDARCFVNLVRTEDIQQDAKKRFGKASDLVQQYTASWRKHFQGKIKEHRDKGNSNGQPWFRALTHNPQAWLSEKAFQERAKLLHQAISKDLNQAASRRVQQLIVRHNHTLLTFQTLKAETADDQEDTEEQPENAEQLRRELQQFRQRFAEHL